MDVEVLEALKGSIKKWKEIVNNNGIDRQADNCPLCAYALKIYPKSANCSTCIIAEKTKQWHCRGTPYIEWINHQYNLHCSESVLKIYCPECKKLAEYELEFLKSLLPKEE